MAKIQKQKTAYAGKIRCEILTLVAPFLGLAIDEVALVFKKGDKKV